MNKEALTILLIEDSEVFGKAVIALIDAASSIAMRIVTAQSLRAGLEILDKEPVDLLLLDLTLPDSRGLDTVTAVRNRSSSVPIVVLSGVEEEATALETLKRGAQDFLFKGDLNPRQLNRAIMFAMERKRLQSVEAERIRLFEQREDFMATLTHDLKNPLIGANRVLELIANGQIGDASEDVQQLLSKVRDSNVALLSMIRNLLEVYRYEKDVNMLVRENFDLSVMVAKYVSEVEPAIKARGVTLAADLPASPFPVYADKSGLLRVLQNLIDNAVKFSPPGENVELKLLGEMDKAVLLVSDHGPGITADDMTRLFQRFWQGRSKQMRMSGSGLGLYLCRQIIEAHNGHIWCESEENQGATFLFSLPAATQIGTLR